MASSSSAKPGGTVKTNRRLGELLQEQQEPFLLDVYLLERGYPSTQRRKGRGHHRSSATPTSGCYPCPRPRNISHGNLKSFPSSGYGLKLNSPIRFVRNLTIPHQINPRVPTTLRTINKPLSVSTSHRRKTKSHHFRACQDDGRVGVTVPVPPELEETTHSPKAAELDRVSSYSSTTVFDSCSDRDKEQQLLSTSVSVSVSPSSTQQDNIGSSSAHNSQASKSWSLNQQEIATDKKECQWGCMEDCHKQLSPVSVLEQVSVPPVSSLHIHLMNSRQKPETVGLCRSRRTIATCRRREEEGKEVNAAWTPIPNQPNNIRVTEDSILSASLWELMLQSSMAQKRDSGGMETIVRELMGSGGLDSSSHSQYVRTKRVLQQTRQLLFDCVREAIEKYQNKTGRRRRRWGGHGGPDQFIGPEELGTIICDEILAWGKKSVDIANLNQLIEADVSETTEEEGWMDFVKALNIGIGLGIADAILDEMSNEIVSDMIHIHVSAFTSSRSKWEITFS